MTALLDPYAGEIDSRETGSLVNLEQGTSTAYSLDNAQQRGALFIGPGVEVYEGMIIGQHNRPGDLPINVTKRKQLTNFRADGKDDAVRLTPPIEMSLDNAIEYIADDEWVEITPKSIRLRKKVLDMQQRMKIEKKAKQAREEA